MAKAAAKSKSKSAGRRDARAKAPAKPRAGSAEEIIVPADFQTVELTK